MIKFDESFYRRSVIPGGQAVVERSYPVGRKNFFRQSKTSLLSVRVCFDEQVTAPDKVCLHFENFAHNKSRVYTERLQGHSREFTCRVFPRFHGVTRFKIKYRLRRRWYWDNRPFSYFIVDPHRLRDIRMYTLIPNVSGHVGDWSQDLERIQALGFNTVHILPVTQMGISESPYAARDLFNLDTAFVNPSDAMPAEQQIESFVERACSLNMRLCFDLVFNNIGVDSLICRMKPEWLTEDPDEEDGIRRGGWDDGRQWHKWQDLAFINYDIPCSYTRDALWDHMRAYALYWSGLAARTNGMIRLDNLHSSHPLFIRWVLGEIRKAF
ncbi:MAG TPA: hypothetical protein VJC18_08580, partial [bacterium]|nr:hypothetical protein [bacterium]